MNESQNEIEKVDERYTIVSNHNRRRILVINHLVDVDTTPELQFEDFDAIFINVMSPIMDRNMLAIRYASPLWSEKCRYKPCYVTERFKGWLGRAEVTVDGYATHPLDHGMAQGIEEIYNNMRSLNFLLGTDPVVTHAEEIFRLCRYAISRRQFTFSSEPTPGLSSGYMAVYYHTLWNENQEYMQMQERHFFHNQLIRLGYIRRTRFIHKIYVCPHCSRSHLLFLERCPKCDSTNLHEEAVIHHFRCANVSPESAYHWDEELRCPKCKHFLRHIGVDYDKPSSVYSCKECGNSFMYPNMNVYCTTCKRTHTTEELREVNIEEFEFTPEGIRAFASTDYKLVVSQVGFYGYSSMRDFQEYIRLFANEEDDTEDIIIVARFYVFDPTADDYEEIYVVPPLVQAMSRFFNYKSTLWGNYFYFLRRVSPGEIAPAQTQMEYELREQFEDYRKLHKGFQFDLVGNYTFSIGDDVDTFIERLEDRRQ